MHCRKFFSLILFKHAISNFQKKFMICEKFIISSLDFWIGFPFSKFQKECIIVNVIQMLFAKGGKHCMLNIGSNIISLTLVFGFNLRIIKKLGFFGKLLMI